MRQHLSKHELAEQFRIQIAKIKSLCDLYDNGDFHFAQEISVKLRLLFHNTANSKSLLKQLKLDHLTFVDTAGTYDSLNLVTHLGLTKMKKDISNWRHVPLGSDVKFKMASYDNWWDSKKIIVDELKKSFTRKKLVTEVADTDGGAHVDSSLTEDYYNLSRRNTAGYGIKINGEQVSLNDIVPPTIRQIAEETIQTFLNIDIEKESKLKDHREITNPTQ